MIRVGMHGEERPGIVADELFGIWKARVAKMERASGLQGTWSKRAI